jgi:hypothetical protein
VYVNSRSLPKTIRLSTTVPFRRLLRPPSTNVPVKRCEKPGASLHHSHVLSRSVISYFGETPRVSKTNNCEVRTKTHAAVAAMEYQDEAKVSAVLSDIETAAIEEPLRATLRMLRKLTREHAVDADDIRAALAAGVSRERLEDALAVCFTFNTVDRLSRTFGWVVAGPKAFEAGAKFLLARGYR